jgi:hypothetical protein
VPTLGAYNVVLTTGGEVATILGGFTVGSGQPQIVRVNPPTGTQGSTSASTSPAFTHWVNGTSTASFGSGITVNSLTVSNSTTRSPTSPSADGHHRLAQRDRHHRRRSATITGGFSVLAGVPTLLSVSPPSPSRRAPATNVTSSGAFTNFQQGVHHGQLRLRHHGQLLVTGQQPHAA